MQRILLVALLISTTIICAGEPKQKKTAVKLADAASRAFEKAKHFDGKLVRVTMSADLGEDEEKALLFAEFGDGTFAIFSGFADPALDQWTVVEGKNIKLLVECAERSKLRSKTGE